MRRELECEDSEDADSRFTIFPLPYPEETKVVFTADDKKEFKQLFAAEFQALKLKDFVKTRPLKVTLRSASTTSLPITGCTGTIEEKQTFAKPANNKHQPILLGTEKFDFTEKYNKELLNTKFQALGREIEPTKTIPHSASTVSLPITRRMTTIELGKTKYDFLPLPYPTDQCKDVRANKFEFHEDDKKEFKQLFAAEFHAEEDQNNRITKTLNIQDLGFKTRNNDVLVLCENSKDEHPKPNILSLPYPTAPFESHLSIELRLRKLTEDIKKLLATEFQDEQYMEQNNIIDTHQSKTTGNTNAMEEAFPVLPRNFKHLMELEDIKFEFTEEAKRGFMQIFDALEHRNTGEFQPGSSQCKTIKSDTIPCPSSGASWPVIGNTTSIVMFGSLSTLGAQLLETIRLSRYYYVSFIVILIICAGAYTFVK